MKKILPTLVFALLALQAPATVDDAISASMEAADSYVKEGYTVREDQWAGDLEVGGKKAIQHTLFKGNDYWFFVASENINAKVSVHVYDGNGKLVEQDAWQKGPASGARLIPKLTGAYYLIVEVQKSNEERTHWALVYAFK